MALGGGVCAAGGGVTPTREGEGVEQRPSPSFWSDGCWLDFFIILFYFTNYLLVTMLLPRQDGAAVGAHGTGWSQDQPRPPSQQIRPSRGSPTAPQQPGHRASEDAAPRAGSHEPRGGSRGLAREPAPGAGSCPAPQESPRERHPPGAHRGVSQGGSGSSWGKDRPYVGHRVAVPQGPLGVRGWLWGGRTAGMWKDESLGTHSKFR